MDKGETIVNIMNTGYDAAVIGNHEFIYGQSRLQTLMKKLNYPLLAANVKYDNGEDFTKSYLIKDLAGIKVGIFGVSNPNHYRKSGKYFRGKIT
jgi:2',3'-cyclic-nucleotide 2'-phosphodiesterase (5'-nucleotidase family)